MDFIYILGWIAVICAIGWRINSSRELSKKVAKDIKEANPNISKEDSNKEIKYFEETVREENKNMIPVVLWIIAGILFVIFFLVPMFTSAITNPSELEDNCYGMGQTYTC
jgi:uncharacterized membrane protein|tara:strand:+ start:305 stop:634 length:330 start_codon:yes stop_codon:yes gene_type:complete